MRLKVYMEWLEKCVSEEVVRNRKICDSLSLLLLQWTGEKQEVLGERCLFKENFLTWIFLCNSIHDRNKRELLMVKSEPRLSHKGALVHLRVEREGLSSDCCHFLNEILGKVFCWVYRVNRRVEVLNRKVRHKVIYW